MPTRRILPHVKRGADDPLPMTLTKRDRWTLFKGYSAGVACLLFFGYASYLPLRQGLTVQGCVVSVMFALLTVFLTLMLIDDARVKVIERHRNEVAAQTWGRHKKSWIERWFRL